MLWKFTKRTLMFCALFHTMLRFWLQKFTKQILPNFHMGLRVKNETWSDIFFCSEFLVLFLWWVLCPWNQTETVWVGSSIYNKETSIFAIFSDPTQPQPFPARTTVHLWQLWLLLVMTSRNAFHNWFQLTLPVTSSRFTQPRRKVGLAGTCNRKGLLWQGT